MRLRLRVEPGTEADSILRSVRVESKWQGRYAYTGHLTITPAWLAALGDPEPLEPFECELEAVHE